jgi:hypothetical protein
MLLTGTPAFAMSCTSALNALDYELENLEGMIASMEGSIGYAEESGADVEGQVDVMDSAQDSFDVFDPNDTTQALEAFDIFVGAFSDFTSLISIQDSNSMTVLSVTEEAMDQVDTVAAKLSDVSGCTY